LLARLAEAQTVLGANAQKQPAYAGTMTLACSPETIPEPGYFQPIDGE
jgi:hypothetical protein